MRKKPYSRLLYAYSITMLTGYGRYDMYKDIEEKLAAKRNVSFTEKFIGGLPLGMKLTNGVTVGQ